MTAKKTDAVVGLCDKAEPASQYARVIAWQSSEIEAGRFCACLSVDCKPSPKYIRATDAALAFASADHRPTTVQASPDCLGC